MKRLVIAALAMGAFVQAYGQGTVTFANNSSHAVSNRLTSAAVVKGTTFRVALYWYNGDLAKPTTEQITAALADQGTSRILWTTNFNAPGSGQYNAGVRVTPTPYAGEAWFQVRAWQASFGDTYENAILNFPSTAVVGESDVLRVAVSASPTAGPGSLLQPGLGFWVEPIPEPTVLALGVLGVGALLLLRRRNRS
jgi:MYXO-CTERM domain-containing protein